MKDSDFNFCAKSLKVIMKKLGVPKDVHNKGTAERIIHMWEEMFSSLKADEFEFKKSLTVFPSEYNSEGDIGSKFITVKDIPFHSMCAHHWLPFMGKCSVKYLPNEYIIGLSKIPRVVNFCAKKPQVQENLTAEIGQMLVDVLNPLKLEVCLYDVLHTCISCRGIESFANTDTNWTYINKEFRQLKGCSW